MIAHYLTYKHKIVSNRNFGDLFSIKSGVIDHADKSLNQVLTNLKRWKLSLEQQTFFFQDSGMLGWRIF